VLRIFKVATHRSRTEPAASRAGTIAAPAPKPHLPQTAADHAKNDRVPALK
jgi:hypothetical protein